MKYIQLFQKKTIERTAGVPYLVRWNLFGLGVDSSIFSIKIHKILTSDEECLHDHPWAFLSIILKQGYVETTKYSDKADRSWSKETWSEKAGFYVMSKMFFPGSVLFRRANWPHRLTVVKPCWTLVFTFCKVRHWGFLTARGWIHWTKYSREKDC